MKEHLFDLREQHLDGIMQLADEVISTESAPDSNLVEMGRYHLQTGGKRLRAIIPVAVVEALDQPPSSVYPFSAACELLHNATLVHDDLQDGDETRRGEPSLWSKCGAEHAVNAGDAMLYWPLLCLDRLDCRDALHRRCVRRFTRRALSVMDGQEREFQLKDTDSPSHEAYVRMVRGKTGGLLQLTLAGAADLGGAPEPVVDAMEQAGAELGVLFQIQDDILDLYGDKGRDQRGADIAEGKISALVVHFLSHAPDEQANWLRDLLARDREATPSEDIERVARAFREVGSLEAAVRDIETRRRRVATLDSLDDHPKLQQLLDGLAEWFVAPIDHVLKATSSPPEHDE